MRTRTFKQRVREALAFLFAMLCVAIIILLLWGAMELILWLTPANSKF